jgi:hypothetical protein
MRRVRFSIKQAFADIPLCGKRFQFVHADLKELSGSYVLLSISSRRLPSSSCLKKITEVQLDDLKGSYLVP